MTQKILLSLALIPSVAGCVGDIVAPSALPEVKEHSAAPPAVRRLSVRELRNTFRSLTGIEPQSLSSVPPDPKDYSYDRIVNAQTVSRAHMDAFASVASEVARVLIEERRLDDLSASCPDNIIPPLAPSVTTNVAGTSLVGRPAWAIQADAPGVLYLLYAPDCGASLSHSFPATGSYRFRFTIDSSSGLNARLVVDGTEVHSWSVGAGSQELAVVRPIAAGTHLVDLDISLSSGSPALRISSLIIEGPIDENPGSSAERLACCEAVVDSLGPLAFRRPLSSAERSRLVALYNQAESFSDGMRAIVESIFQSPKFLYLIEMGEPIPDMSAYQLNDYEIAARLSYAICESPPDDELRQAAARGELSQSGQIQHQARRLFSQPCARETVARFYKQWLWLDRLPDLAKDPQVYPTFGAGMRDALIRESDQFLHQMTWLEDANVAQLYSSQSAWLNAETAPLYGLQLSGSELQKVELPSERMGLLTNPALLSVTAKFSQTSPVIRGVYVLEQILCVDLPPPPSGLNITPPPLDPNATTQERWQAHSGAPSCAPCHSQIDPIGFSFEQFDALGQHRTHENGLAIDATGGLPALDIDMGSFVGAASLAGAIAESQLAVDCFARQWLRFALGRLEEVPDAATLANLTNALQRGSIRDGLIALTADEGFTRRVERKVQQ